MHVFNEGKGPIKSFSFNPKEFVIAINFSDAVRVYDIQNFDWISTLQDDRCDRLVFSKDGQHLVTTGSDYIQLNEWEPFSVVEIYRERISSARDLQFLNDNLMHCSIGRNTIDYNCFSLSNISKTKHSSEKSCESKDYDINHKHTKNYDINDSENPFLDKDENDTLYGDLDEKLNSKHTKQIETNQITVKEKFRYYPRPNGNKPLDLDLASFIKNVILTLI